MEVLSATDAKKEYFLDSKDLLRVPFESEYPGFGNGRATKWFKSEDLEYVALCKHGSEELAQKPKNRVKRAENLRMKTMMAAMAQVALEQEPNETLTPMSAEIISDISKDIVKAFTPNITWDYLNAHKCTKDVKVLAHVVLIGHFRFAAKSLPASLVSGWPSMQC
jgi:hypothetical protein